ncbi:MAG: ATPase P [Candidatus Chloroheliales bacterium]|nr:MAG: ATPase P [Chloroflexota bacterium]
MIEIEVPNWKKLKLEHLALDINGTLTLDGELIQGVDERIWKLAEQLHIVLLSADTLGKANVAAERLRVELHLLDKQQSGAEQKAIYVSNLGAHNVVAIGNGANDGAMLFMAGLGIAVLGPEGLANEAMENADVVARDITTALDLLLHPNRLIASLRG